MSKKTPAESALYVRLPATAVDKNVNVEMTLDNWPHTKLRGLFWARWTERCEP